MSDSNPVPPELRDQEEGNIKTAVDEVAKEFETKLSADAQKRYQKLKNDLRYYSERNSVLEEQASELEGAARQSSAERVEAESKLAQVGDLVEGLFRGVISIPKIAARLSLRAYTAERNLKEAVGLLNQKTNYLPYIIVIFGMAALVLILADPAYAIPLGNFIQTPGGEVILVVFLAVAGIIGYRLTR